MNDRDFKEAAKDAIRALPALRVTNTEYVPQLKRRPDQGIDRAAALLAIEHLNLAATPPTPTLDVGTLEWALRAAGFRDVEGQDAANIADYYAAKLSEASDA